jgi:hypothetical protein
MNISVYLNLLLQVSAKATVHCHQCNQQIKKGVEHYQHSFNPSENQFYVRSHRYCSSCVAEIQSEIQFKLESELDKIKRSQLKRKEKSTKYSMIQKL